ncbi:sulfatase family protein [Galbibacter mesophilus]|uniref:sulfatase family protein n=1 Tax=Galbibacter mesophilus TaxID=379069 RepID=UPI00191EA762|nr:sulfatase-like hydrolase/transferase [Galbibacter mesophilus]MCM5663072.1 sulfatase-like hydrolase/transferase [Galbibacter mesophilus]
MKTSPFYNRGSCYLKILLFAFILSSCTDKKEKTTQHFYEHVVVIVGDDHAQGVVGAYGNEIIRTPNIDALADDGLLFKNAYANSPLCSASRQSLLTGKYPHATGVNLLFTPFNDRTNTTIAEHLKQGGFKTAMFGKQHFNTWIWGELYKNGMPKFGFDTLVDHREYKRWLSSVNMPKIPDSIPLYGKDDKELPKHKAQLNPKTLSQPYFDKYAEGTFLANSATDFIKKNKNGRMFLWVAFHEPHAPFAFPIEYSNKYNPIDMPLPKGSNEDDAWIPARYKDLTDEEKRGIIASYYTSTEYMDKNVGMVINALKAEGIYDKTLIIYLGDQGYLLNDHKRFEKHTMWEEAIKAPLIIAGKKMSKKGSSRDELVEFVDIAPLIAEATGLPELETAQGTSFLQNLEGNTSDEIQGEDDYVFAEFLEDNKAMVATKKWKYIFSTGKRDLGQGYQTGNGAFGIYHKLYDLQNDPTETSNLAHKKENAPLVANMQQKMLQHFIKTHPYAKEVPETLTTVGKLVWFCEPRDVGAEYGGEPLRVFQNKKEPISIK